MPLGVMPVSRPHGDAGGAGAADGVSAPRVFPEGNVYVVGGRYKLISEYPQNDGDEILPPSAATHQIGRRQLFDHEAPWTVAPCGREAREPSSNTPCAVYSE